MSGVGKVGFGVVRHLVSEGARVAIADVDPHALEVVSARHGVEVVPVDTAHRRECDIYSPCAMGGALNPTTIPELRCAAVVGCANNQLADPSCAGLLAEAGVLWATDYVVNAGGLINLAEELSPGGYEPERARAAVGRIFDTTAVLLTNAEAAGITTAEAADRMAESRLRAGVGTARTGTDLARATG